MCNYYKNKKLSYRQQVAHQLQVHTGVWQTDGWTESLRSNIIIIIRNEYDYGGVMSEDCKDTLQTKQ